MAASAGPSSLVPRAFSARWGPRGGIGSGRRLFSSTSIPSSPALLPGSHLRSSAVALARRRKNASTAQPSKHKKMLQNDEHEEEDIDEDAFEALFSQLEEDLKNDSLSDDGAGDEITEEDMARLEQELEEALGDGHYDDLSRVPADGLDGDDKSDEEERRPQLKNWQMRRLARALKIGRRKTSIKSLASELGLERAYVIELLRDPPPNLLLMSASIPDEVTQTPSVPGNKQPESPPMTAIDAAESKPEAKLPVHVMRTRWSTQKRLKKVQVETLERVYSRTKRPTNAMISSIVHVTNLPWKTVVKWFEDKRLQDGVPEHRVPYRRSTPETISTS
uniref:Protein OVEREXPRESSOR OF CATIONIC PEROXIDASE 3 n=2 Tax=Elaeis guineensis var. tenera TaxID=51953 RepID=A0A6I9QXQ3_ELAGV|nr:protein OVEREXPRESSOR OF CATIONIC PEROXIDASE 3 [Elaeis guineensis]XP_010914898.1 protein OVEREXPRESSOR OF CATIONIC PEROXIDASE 3 [Elaeis guineensis]